MRIIELEGKTIVAMPSRQQKDGKRRVDLIHPINQAAREKFNTSVLGAYDLMRNTPEMLDCTFAKYDVKSGKFVESERRQSLPETGSSSVGMVVGNVIERKYDNS
jgi:hypothetical protein